MTARTLEEIEALAAEATPGPWYAMDVHGWYDIRSEGAMIVGDQGVDSEKNAELIAALPDIFAIAQEQRAEIARLKRAIIAANSGVIAGEGVGLAYYMENCYGVEDSPAESVEVIHRVTGE